jgi:hypothetical protein
MPRRHAAIKLMPPSADQEHPDSKHPRPRPSSTVESNRLEESSLQFVFPLLSPELVLKIMGQLEDAIMTILFAPILRL